MQGAVWMCKKPCSQVVVKNLFGVDFFNFFLVTCFVFERVVMVEVDNMRKTLKNK